MQGLYAGVQSAFQQTRGTSGEPLAAKVRLAQQALRHAADDLSRARPPAEVEEDNRALADAMRAYAAALEPAVGAAARGDEQAMARFQDPSTDAAVRAMAAAAQRMKKKGYELGPIAKD